MRSKGIFRRFGVCWGGSRVGGRFGVKWHSGGCRGRGGWSRRGEQVLLEASLPSRNPSRSGRRRI